MESGFLMRKRDSRLVRGKDFFARPNLIVFVLSHRACIVRGDPSHRSSRFVEILRSSTTVFKAFVPRASLHYQCAMNFLVPYTRDVKNICKFKYD